MRSINLYRATVFIAHSSPLEATCPFLATVLERTKERKEREGKKKGGGTEKPTNQIEIYAEQSAAKTCLCELIIKANVGGKWCHQNTRRHAPKRKKIANLRNLDDD